MCSACVSGGLSVFLSHSFTPILLNATSLKCALRRGMDCTLIACLCSQSMVILCAIVNPSLQTTSKAMEVGITDCVQHMYFIYTSWVRENLI